MSNNDSIKWSPVARVLKYNPDTLREVAAFLDVRNLRSADRYGKEPNGPELRLMESMYGLVPDDEAVAVGNLLTTAGLIRIVNLITGGGGAAFNHAQSFCGVGDGSTAATVSDVDLAAAAGSTHRWFQGTDSSNPSVTGTNGVITCNTTYQSGDGNFAWNEWTLGVATGTITATSVIASVGTSPIMLNRKVQSLGTKASGAVWTLQATITLS